MIQAGIFPPDRLPRSCFNPMIKRARYPSTLDTFHYFPLSSRFRNEESFRFNTAQVHSNDLILSMDPTAAQFFRPPIRKGKTIFDRQNDFIHYRYASQLTARIICGTSGSLSPPLTDNGAELPRLLRFLNRDTGKWCRSHWIIRASQEMACNQALWSVIEPIISHIVKVLPPKDGLRLSSDLQAIKSHLLTGEGLFANLFSVTTSKSVADLSLRLRKDIWGYVRLVVSRLRSLFLEPLSLDDSTGSTQLLEKSLENDRMLSKKPEILSIEEVIDRFLSSPTEQTSHGLKLPQLERIPPPFLVSFSSLFTQTRSSIGDRQNSDLNELFSQITHVGKVDITVVQLTMASLLAELSCRRLTLRNCTEQTYSVNMKAILATHQHLLSYLDTTCLLLGNFCKTIRKVVISSPLAITVLLRQSYIGNIVIDSSIARKRNRSSEDDDDDTSLDRFQSHTRTLRGDMRVAAENLVSLGEAIKDFQLPMFADIHLTTGIAELCTILSCDAADILSRSWAPDDVVFRTPFDLVRLALTKMDSTGHIFRDAVFSISSDGTSVSKMIVTFEKVADVFQQCLSYNAYDVINLSWHLAAR